MKHDKDYIGAFKYAFGPLIGPLLLIAFASAFIAMVVVFTIVLFRSPA